MHYEFLFKKYKTYLTRNASIIFLAQENILSNDGLSTVKFEFKSYLNWQSADATGEVTVTMLLTVGELFGHTDIFYAGINYHSWHSEFR